MNKFLPTLFLILVALFSFAQEDTICVNTTTQFSPIGNPALTNPWISSDVNIATIDNNGLATGVSAGACVITYTDEFNVTTNFDLVVEFPLNTNPVLVSAVGTDGQTLDFDSIYLNDYYYQPLVDIVYQVGPGATIALSPSSQLPLGVTATVVGNTLTISGTPYTDNPITNPITFSYTIIGSGINSCTVFTPGLPNSETNSVDGTLTLNAPCVNNISPGDFISLCTTDTYSFTVSFGGSATSVNVSGTPGSVIINSNSVTISGTANPFGEQFTITTEGGACIQASTTCGYSINGGVGYISSFSNLNQTVCVGQSIEEISIDGIDGLMWDMSDFPMGLDQTLNSFLTNLTISGIPTSTGIYNFTVTASDNCSLLGSDLSGTISVLPSPVTPTIITNGPTTFCEGESVTLTSSATSGNIWTGGETDQNILVSTSGNYVVNVTENGCTSLNSTPVSVIVNPLPPVPSISAGGSVSFCQGQSVTLTSDITSGIVWSPGGQTTPSITVTTADNFFVTNTLNGCSGTSLVVSTSVNAIPTPTISAIADICNNASPITLTQGSPSGGIYTVNGVQMTSFAPNNSNIGSNIVEYTLTQNGCSASASTTLNVLNCTGVGLEETNLSIQLFPNPTNGIIEIKGIDKTEITSIKVYDQVGKLILIVANDNQINLSEYANGMYNLVITTKTFDSTQKIQLIK